MTTSLDCTVCASPVPEGVSFCPACGCRVRLIDHSGRVVKGSFRLEERIGAGAMGVIYRARQLSLDKVVAVKVLHDNLASDKEIVKRFHREAHAAGCLRHPHTITIIDFGQTEDGMLFIAMEYLDGRDLGRILGETGHLTPQRAVHIAMQVLEALDEAHAEGIVHRDLKPENIVISTLRMEPDFVKVLDFGIAKIQDPKRAEGLRFRTLAGFVCGTPEYMAPEQVRGDPIDGRADLYSLGVVLFEMLTGQLPFYGGPMLSIATRQLTEPPPAVSALVAGVPPELEAIVERLLAKNPDQRFHSARAAHTALTAVAQSMSSVRLAAVEASAAPPPFESGPPVESLHEDTHWHSLTPSSQSMRLTPLRLLAIAAATVTLSAVLTGVVRGGFGSPSALEVGGEPEPSFGDDLAAMAPTPASELLSAKAPATAAADMTPKPERVEPTTEPVMPTAERVMPPTNEPLAGEAAAGEVVAAARALEPVFGLRQAGVPATLLLGLATSTAAVRDIEAPEVKQRRAPERSPRVATPPRPPPTSAGSPTGSPVAGPKRARSEAEAYDQKGHDAAKAGRWRDAIAAWLVANDLSPKPSTLLNIARGYLRLGIPGRACVYLQRYGKAVGNAVPSAAAALIAEGRCR